MNHKTMEEELEKLGFKVIDVKDYFLDHLYHIYAVYKNNYALSICQGKWLHSGFGTFEVALGGYDKNEFHLIYKGKWKDDVLGWQTPEDVIELAESVKRFRTIKEPKGVK